MKLNRKYLWNILLIVCITAVAMYFTLKDNFNAIMDAIGRMNPMILVLVLIWGMLYNAVWGVSFQLMGKRYVKNYSLLEGLEVAFVGTFFAGITPSATGGQFGQIYILKKQGINVADGASLLWADFIIYQTAMMIYVTILFALRFMHYANLSAWFWMVFVGYVINMVVVVGLYLIALFPNFFIHLAKGASSILKKLKFVKNPEHLVETWMSQVKNFTVEIRKLSGDWELIAGCMIVNLIRLTLYYALPFVIARSLGIRLQLNQLVDVMALSSFVSMANSFIPLPGASGGTEVVFTLLFSGMLGKLTGAVLLLWRVSSYYVPVIAGAVIFILLKTHYDHQAARQQKLLARQTLPGSAATVPDGLQTASAPPARGSASTPSSTERSDIKESGVVSGPSEPAALPDPGKTKTDLNSQIQVHLSQEDNPKQKEAALAEKSNSKDSSKV